MTTTRAQAARWNTETINAQRLFLGSNRTQDCCSTTSSSGSCKLYGLVWKPVKRAAWSFLPNNTGVATAAVVAVRSGMGDQPRSDPFLGSNPHDSSTTPPRRYVCSLATPRQRYFRGEATVGCPPADCLSAVRPTTWRACVSVRACQGTKPALEFVTRTERGGIRPAGCMCWLVM